MVTTNTRHVHTLIVGGGITGLSTAYALEKRGHHDYLVVEAKERLGGLCATTHLNGYSFDYGGHLLHLHTAFGKKFIHQLLANNLQKHKRNAFIYTHGMRVPYPFQHNLWAMHPELRDLCLLELERFTPAQAAPINFEDWCLQSFGTVLYEAFFRPYNKKLWGRPLTQMTCDWCGLVPTPQLQEMKQSAQQAPTRPQGYNATFYYPKTGGIGALINALASRVPNVQTHAAVTRVNFTTKTAWINDSPIHFEQLVNTIALPTFVNLLDKNEPLKKAATQLEAQPITIYHLAIARSVSPFSWIYCPDEAQPFYRVGLQSSFAPDSVPDSNISLFYVELPGLAPQTPANETHIWQGLHQKGIVNIEDVKLFSAWQSIPNAYVIFNTTRAKVVPFLLNELAQQHCYCAGRYGRWEYSFMERSIVEADELAHHLVKLV